MKNLFTLVLLTLFAGFASAQVGSPNSASAQHCRTSATNPLQAFQRLTLPGLSVFSQSIPLVQRYQVRGDSLPTDFTVTGLPCDGTIYGAYLYYIVEGDPLTTVQDTFSLTDPNGNSISYTADFLGFEAGGKCWGRAGNSHYRADVTNIILGDGIYTLTGLTQSYDSTNANNTLPDSDTDGATLMIVYLEPFTTYEGHLVLFDGNRLNIGFGDTIVIDSLDLCENVDSVFAFSAFGDFQDNVQPDIVFTAGDSVGNFYPDFYDYEMLVLPLDSGTQALTLTADHPGDCWSWIFGGVYYKTYNCNSVSLGNCTDVQNYLSVLTGTSGKNEVPLTLKAIPNPSKGNPVLQWNQDKAGTTFVTVTGLDGRTLYSGSDLYSAGNHTIGIPQQLSSGFYFVRLISGSQSESIKLIVE
jgi:hypothetical protein